MTEQEETVRDLASLIVAALNRDEDTGVFHAERIATRLGIDDADDPDSVASILRGELRTATTGVGR